jgi:hypothetical protein
MFLIVPLLPTSGSYLRVKRFATLTTGSPYSNNYLIITFFASGKRNAETILCAYILPGTIFGA